MIRHRQLRRELPDSDWIERFADGESLRSLGRELGVAHTTLARRLRRPELASLLCEVGERLDAERKARALERAEERRLERDLPRRAREAAKRDKELAAWSSSPRQFPNSEYAQWIEDRSGPRGRSSQERMNEHNELAARAVEAGGGVEEVIDATGLRSRRNVYQLIYPRTVQKARAHERRRQQKERLEAIPLRRLKPDPNLFARRAAGEPLRRLAADYGVSHATLSRYFKRPESAEELRRQRRELERQWRRWRSLAGEDQAEGLSTLEQLAAQIRKIRCPRHPYWLQVSSQDELGRETQLLVSYCCWDAEQELIRRLQIDHNLRPGDVVTIHQPQT